MRTLAEEIASCLSRGRGEELVRLGQGETAWQYRFDGDASVRDFLRGVGTAAPYLRSLLGRPACAQCLERPAEESLARLLAKAAGGEGEPRSRLRAAKAEMALLLALTDLSGLWPMTKVTRSLSDFADACVEGALRAAWEEVAQLRKADIPLPESGPVPGLSAIAMGKLGARELNYSSDIDLIVVYDPERMVLGPEDRMGAKAAAVRAAQALLSVLSDQTPEGYVFRTDLRLRPDPSTTPLAVSLERAERYYETYGQNWERAAHIKARACAGDRTVGAEYLRMIAPFVWRRTLDYAAISDIHAVKKQIHARKGNPDIVAAGGDVKLGPGGIREVEFFVQTQQLIFGGRAPELRAPATLDALSALAAAGQIDEATADRLTDAYTTLRDVEHRIQMRHDNPSQTIPADKQARAALAVMMDCADLNAFEGLVERELVAIHDAYAELFEAPEPEEAPPGSLVFTGVEDDPRTIETLARMGFGEPSAVAGAIRSWHQGSIPAARSVKAREVLTGLVPRLLGTIAEQGEPDAAFRAFDAFLRLLPSGLQLFSLFTANPEVMDDVIALCAASPDLAMRMGKRPALVEALIEDDTLPPLSLPPGIGLEEAMDIVRRRVREERLRRSAELTLARADVPGTARALSDLADQAVGVLADAVDEDLRGRGADMTASLAILAFGRYGTQRLTAASDLDLVFVYDAPPLEAAAVLKRVRRLVTALSVPTAEGELYEVDMKLRPSGGAGPAAVSVEAFSRYYEETARVWEAMALTKARIVRAEPQLEERLRDIITQRLIAPRDPAATAAAVRDMRQRLAEGQPPRGPFDVKRMDGGLTEIDFLAQYLALISGSPSPRATPDSLMAAGEAGRLDPDAASTLLRAYGLFEAVIQFMRATFGQEQPKSLSPAQRVRLEKLTGADGPIEEAIAAAQDEVGGLFAKLLP